MQFWMSQYPFLWDIILRHGVQAIQHKLYMLTEVALPKTKTELQFFSRTVNYLMKYSLVASEVCDINEISLDLEHDMPVTV